MTGEDLYKKWCRALCEHGAGRHATWPLIDEGVSIGEFGEFEQSLFMRHLDVRALGMTDGPQDAADRGPLTLAVDADIEVRPTDDGELFEATVRIHRPGGFMFCAVDSLWARHADPERFGAEFFAAYEQHRGERPELRSRLVYGGLRVRQGWFVGGHAGGVEAVLRGSRAALDGAVDRGLEITADSDELLVRSLGPGGDGVFVGFEALSWSANGVVQLAAN
jgi:hypothetical protein